MSHTDEFFGRLNAVYGDPKTENVSGFLAEYTRMLGRYTKAELDKAADKILTRHKIRTWPTIPECVEAAEDARSVFQAAQLTRNRNGSPYQGPDAKRLAADWVLNTQQGRDAVKGRYARKAWALVAQQIEAEQPANHREIELPAETVDYFAKACAKRNGYLLDLSVIFGTEENARRIAGIFNLDLEEPMADIKEFAVTKVPPTFCADMERLQRNSPNRTLHTNLTGVTRRMTGEHQE